MTELLIHNILVDLTVEELIGFLAIFVDESRGDSMATIDGVENKQIRNKLIEINKIIDEYKSYEKQLKLTTELDIYYDMINASYMWACGKSIREIKETTEIYEGNFVKDMLKITNIATELIDLCQIFGDFKILPKLEQIQKLIMRDIVNLNSLYIS